MKEAKRRMKRQKRRMNETKRWEGRMKSKGLKAKEMKPKMCKNTIDTGKLQSCTRKY